MSGVLVPGTGILERDAAGGKGWRLARLASLAGTSGFRVPRFVVVGTEVFDAVVAPLARGAGGSEARRAAILALDVPAGLAQEVLGALAAAGLAGRSIAVRSSAVAEDGAAASFAGQFDTVLGVEANDGPALWNALRQVWSSTLSAHATAYAGRSDAPATRMAVVLQELVTPFASGVAFSVDPVSRDPDTAVVSAVYGLGEGLVSGELDADTYHVRFTGGAAVVRAALAHKDRAVRAVAGGGTALVAVPAEDRDRAVLADEAARRVAACARAIATAEGAPQDVEWALVAEEGSQALVILQTRPITTLARAPAAAELSPAAMPAAHASAAAPPSPPAASLGSRRVWDNSNIVESYSGVTTPLTFSFARSVYEDVYVQFCRLMGVSESMLVTHRAVFANLLGLTRGRVYYNLLNWYRTLALLPGFTFNRTFMERMMGVREALEDPPPPPGAGSRVRDLMALVRMLVRMIREHGKLAREVPRFHARVEAALAPVAAADLSVWPEADLLALYDRLSRDLLQHWRPPLVNDFFAMIFFGVQGRMIDRWLPGSPATLANDLLCGEGGIISTEPARRVMALAQVARETEAVAVALALGTPEVVRAGLAADPACAEFRREFDAYVARFGDRCLEELKLETVTLREDPAFLIDMIRSYAERGTADPAAQAEREASIRRNAEAHVRGRLGGIRRAVFFWVLRRTRARVRDRENLRFERTRVFGVVRRIVLGLGTRFAARGVITEAREVFWLTIEEVMAAAAGERTGAAPRTIADRDDRPRPVGAFHETIRERRAAFAAWAAGPAPPDRFETQVPPRSRFGAESGEPESDAVFAPAAAGADLHGTGCCPGVVRERVRIVRDPREAQDVTGRILVAERTDPGWTLLFPAVRGLLVQRGSLLSHSAIVAREMGLPCVVGIAGLLDTLHDGECVEMDGTTGVVRRLGADAP